MASSEDDNVLHSNLPLAVGVTLNDKNNMESCTDKTVTSTANRDNIQVGNKEERELQFLNSTPAKHETSSDLESEIITTIADNNPTEKVDTEGIDKSFDETCGTVESAEENGETPEIGVNVSEDDKKTCNDTVVQEHPRNTSADAVLDTADASTSTEISMNSPESAGRIAVEALEDVSCEVACDTAAETNTQVSETNTQVSEIVDGNAAISLSERSAEKSVESSSDSVVESGTDCAIASTDQDEAVSTGGFAVEGPNEGVAKSIGESVVESTGVISGERCREWTVESSGESGGESAEESVDGIADEGAEETSRVSWACETAFGANAVTAVENVVGSIADSTLATSLETVNDSVTKSTPIVFNTSANTSGESGPDIASGNSGPKKQPQIQMEADVSDNCANKSDCAQSTQQMNQTRDLAVPLVLSLPIDSLHCIASFLSLVELSNYGQTCKVASRVCVDIFRRVRMHGFRCATEVITAWKSGEHADAKEIAALYIQQGVPIYPNCLGHSYHTVSWRMGVETKEMLNDAEESDNTASAGEEDSERTRNKVDKFYSDRLNFRTRDGNSQRVSYLEEKCLYWLEQNGILEPPPPASPPPPPAQPFNPVALFFNRNLLHQQNFPPLPPEVPADDGDADADPTMAPIRPPAAPDGSVRGLHRPVSTAVVPSLSASNSKADAQTGNQSKITLKIHRHLLDQHLLGRASVDDEDGAMQTSPVSLSADFFHPIIKSGNNFAVSKPITSTESLAEELMGSEVGSTLDQTDSGIAANSRQLIEANSWMTTPSQRALPYAEFIELNEFQSELAPQISTSASLGTSPPQQESSVDDAWSPSPRQHLVSILNYVDLEVYNSISSNAKINNESGTSELKRHLRTRFSVYQRRLEILLARSDSSGFDECLLDFWDEFLPLTANIHYYDQHTAVPRVSGLHRFLTRPCPKAIGVVQCEIERIKINSRRKGVSMKGRLFPMYEYRLFIRDRSHVHNSSDNNSITDADGTRRDTVMMIAKNRGRKHVEMSGSMPVSSSSKKGANNYYLYMPQQADVDTHYNKVNEDGEKIEKNANGASYITKPSGEDPASLLLGRLQSNFIGTEFQIFTPRISKRRHRPSTHSRAMSEGHLSGGEDDCSGGYDSGFSSDNASSNSRRRNRFRISLRRSSDPFPVEENRSTFERRSLHGVSSSDRAGGRPVRMNRRAIANSMEVSEAQRSHPVLCEEEDGVITYTANLLGSRPRIMDVCIPKVSLDGCPGQEWKKYLEGCVDPDDNYASNQMLNSFKQLQQRLENQDMEENNEENVDNNEVDPPGDFGLLALQNRPPWWNIELGSFVLNFRGRVSVASVKNFQLCDRNDHDHIMLQFGRIHGRHAFTMDFQYPLTAVQAFSIAISSLQSKISFG